MLGTRHSPLGSGCWMQDTGYQILDTGQIMDDLVPISFPEEKSFIGNAWYSALGNRQL